MYISSTAEWISLTLLVVGVAAAYALFLIAFMAYRLYRDQKISRTFDVIMHADLGVSPILTHTRDMEFQTTLLLRGLHGELVDENEKILYREALIILNRLEAVSIGVIRGFYSEDVLFDYSRWPIIYSYRVAQAYIEALRSRSNNPSFYVNLEAIARRWESRGRAFD